MIKRFIAWIKKEDFWDLMAWASLAMIFFWAVAKSFGWINTPTVIEMIPIFGAVFWAGRMFQQHEDIKKDLKDFKKETKHNFSEIKSEINTIDKRLIRVETKLGS